MSAEGLINRAMTRFQANDFDGAANDLVVILKQHVPGAPLSPPQIQALHLYAQCQMRKGQIELALSNLYLLYRNLDPPNERVQRTIFECLTRARNFREDPDTVAHLVAYLRRDDEPHAQVELPVSLLLAGRYRVDDPEHQIDLVQLAADDLLLTALATLKLPLPGLERFLNDLRRTLLYIGGNGPLPALLEPLVLAMAVRGCNNEYVCHVDPDERRQVEDLIAGLPQAPIDADWLRAHQHVIVVAAMYAPLSALFDAASLEAVPLSAWPTLLRILGERSIHEPARERALRAHLRTLGAIDDPVSRRVQAQYEANPYPRWRTLLRLPNRVSYARAMGEPANALRQSERFLGPLRILIAGCGTGSHPLTSAVNLSPGTKVTAVDLCGASLGYAMRMAESIGVDNVEFVQGDLLEVHRLGVRFDVIESVGVLHHMRDPEAGLRALLGQLEPGGVMKLGLYSSAARAKINRFRSRVAAEPRRRDPEFIREFRHQLLLSGEAAELPHGDFYSLSECRDLLFHEQEHQFTIPQIEAMLERNGLVFLGFTFGRSEAVHNAFRQRHPEPASLRNLSDWAAFEAEHPRTFSGMYQFFVQRTG